MSELDDLYAEVVKPSKDEVRPVIPSKYDSPLKAGLAGAARAITFGASDPLLRYGFNVHPETLEGLKEENPISSIVGEIGGIGASLASGIGAPAGIAKAGLLARGAVGATRGARLLGAARAGAAEGGLYGLSQYISSTGTEENPDLSAEKLFASVAGGAATGAPLSMTGQAFGEGLKAAADAVASKLNGRTLRESLKDLAAKGLVRSVAQGADYSKGKLDDAVEIGRFGLENAKFSERADPYRMAEKFAAVRKKIGDERLGEVLDEADAAAKAAAEKRALGADFHQPLPEPTKAEGIKAQLPALKRRLDADGRYQIPDDFLPAKEADTLVPPKTGDLYQIPDDLLPQAERSGVEFTYRRAPHIEDITQSAKTKNIDTVAGRPRDVDRRLLTQESAAGEGFLPEAADSAGAVTKRMTPLLKDVEDAIYSGRASALLPDVETLPQAEKEVISYVKKLDPSGILTKLPKLNKGAGFNAIPAVAKGRALVNNLRRDPAARDLVKAFDNLLDGYLEEQVKGPFSFRKAFELQSDLRAKLPEGNVLSQKNALLNQWKEIIKEEIRDQAEALVPSAAPRIRAAMRDYRSAKVLEDLAGEKIARLEGGGGGGLEAAVAGGIIGGGPMGAGAGYLLKKGASRYGRGLSAHLLNELADSAAVKAMGNGLKKVVDSGLQFNPLWGGVFRAELELASAKGAQALLEKHIELADKDPSYLGTVGHIDEDPQTLDALAGRATQLEQTARILKAQNDRREKVFDRFLKGVSPRRDKRQISLKEYNSLYETYSRAAADPDYLASIVAPEGLDRVAPDMQPQLAAVGVRAALYLRSVMPKPPSVEAVPSLERNWKPSALQLSRWGRCIEAVRNPNSVIEGIQDGSVTKEGVDALKVVYPQIYADTQRALMERLATHKKLLTAQQRSAIASFNRSTFAGAGARSRLLLMQNLYNTQKQVQPAGGGDGRQDVDQEDNMETQAQRIEGR